MKKLIPVSIIFLAAVLGCRFSTKSGSANRNLTFPRSNPTSVSNPSAAVNDPALANSFAQLIADQDKADETGDKDTLNRILDDSYTQLFTDGTTGTKQQIINGLARNPKFVKVNVTNAQITSNDGTKATVSCLETFIYTDKTDKQSGTYTIVSRNGRWLLAGYDGNTIE